jgi:4a-hydroxytetrahydrobiopterin dehydratase
MKTITEVPEGWEYNGKELFRTFVFKDFREAFAFMAKGALISEKLDHHPDWRNVYNKVEIRLSTHSVGGVTEKDLEWIKLL